MKTCRDYQEAAIGATFDYLQNKKGMPLIVAPVGAGKSLIIAELINRAMAMHRSKVIVLAHVKELLVQNAEELYGQNPVLDVGFYCAGLGKKELHHDITFASIQSIHNKVYSLDRAPELIFVDEAHLISHNKDTSYRNFVDACLSLNPNCRIIGLTGTAFRTDTGRLDVGNDKLFDDIAYEIPITYMIDEGYWCKPITPDVQTKMDTTGVGVRNGDYISGQLEQAVNVSSVTSSCVSEIITQASDRRKVLIFTAGVQHCESVVEELRNSGETARMLTGDTPKAERARLLKEYKANKFKYLVNVAVLTTGFNEPSIDCIVFMRPTRSPVLYIQCLGRGVRTVYAKGHDLSAKQERLEAIAASNKKDCLVLDFGGVIDELGPIDTLDVNKHIREKNKDDQIEAQTKERNVMKQCPECEAYAHPAQNYCYDCSFSFVDQKLEQEAKKKALLISTDEEPQWMEVTFMSVAKHQKRNDPDATPSMRVTYSNFQNTQSDYICYEHNGFALNKALEWHKKRCLTPNDTPKTIDEACSFEFKKPQKILLKKDGKYYRIIDYLDPVEEELTLDDL